MYFCFVVFLSTLIIDGLFLFNASYDFRYARVNYILNLKGFIAIYFSTLFYLFA